MRRCGWLLTLCCAACGGGASFVNDGSAPEDGAAALSTNDFLAQQVIETCAASFACCSSTTAMMEWSVPDGAHCSSTPSAQPAALPMYTQALAAGTVVFHADQASACLAAIRAWEQCGQPFAAVNAQTVAACGNVFTGTLSTGAACDPTAAPNGGCTNDLLCSVASNPATCVARGAAGSPCTAGTCLPSLICLASGQCSAPLADGAACKAGFDCASGVCTGGGAGGTCVANSTVRAALCP